MIIMTDVQYPFYYSKTWTCHSVIPISNIVLHDIFGGGHQALNLEEQKFYFKTNKSVYFCAPRIWKKHFSKQLYAWHF